MFLSLPHENDPEWMLSLRTLAMPADANPNGDIFGGWLMAQMDLAGGNYAYQYARGRVATIAVTGMSFHQAVYVGDEVSCYCKRVKLGTTSMTIHIETWVRRHRDNKVIKVTEAMFTFVGIDENGRKRPLPKYAEDM